MLGLAGEPSEQRSWEEVAAAKPQVVIVAPCGYDVERGYQEALAYGDELAALGAERIVVADAAAWFSRPGPRLVEGLEWLGHVLHPDRVPEPPGGVRDLSRTTAKIEPATTAAPITTHAMTAGSSSRRRLASSSTTNVATSRRSIRRRGRRARCHGSRTGS